MNHFTTTSFWKSFDKLSPSWKQKADTSFEILKSNPSHPSLHLKKVKNYWSVRIGRKYRALGIETNEGVIWFLLGNHTEYDKLIK